MKTTKVNKLTRFIAYVAATLTALFMQLNMACGQVAEAEDKTLSPYFFVKSDNPEIDQLPLKSTSADVNIAGVIADVRITQVFLRNLGTDRARQVHLALSQTHKQSET